jgi:large subunit ribosomal protein L24
MISQSFKSSEKERKQRKFRALAPLHSKHKLLSANLSKELRKKHGRRSFPLRKNDSVKIMRGQFKKKTGKVLIVNMKKAKIYIEGIQRNKRDGTKVNVPFDPSNVQIISLDLEDKKRTKALGRKK